MNYKDVLRDSGFKYFEDSDSWKKNLGFGQFIVVELIFGTLFRVTKRDKVYYNDFVSSFSNFQKIIKEVLVYETELL
tara:strand:+ start:3902 stop:4132 length:231 start_codon:yes stop_codon:yes gene_type:complete